MEKGSFRGRGNLAKHLSPEHGGEVDSWGEVAEKPLPWEHWGEVVAQIKPLSSTGIYF